MERSWEIITNTAKGEKHVQRPDCAWHPWYKTYLNLPMFLERKLDVGIFAALEWTRLFV